MNPFFIFDNLSTEWRAKLKKYSHVVYFFPKVAFYIILFGLSYLVIVSELSPETVIVQNDKHVFSSVNRICFYENSEIFKECIEFGNDRKNVKIDSKKIDLVDDLYILSIEIK